MTTALIFSVLLLLILLDMPIVIAIGLTAVIFFVGQGQGNFLAMLPQRMYAGTTSFVLLAVPFFILAGNLMNTGGITTRIFRFAKALVGHIPGGLGHVSVLSSMIFSGMSGSAVADAAGLGQIQHKAMVDNGYKPAASAAIVASASTIGPVIPPSIPFVLYGALTLVSVARLFLAGFVPGVFMGLAMMAAIALMAKPRGFPRSKRADLRELLVSFKEAFLSLMAPVIIIGGIFSGIFTPTEASVVSFWRRSFSGRTATFTVTPGALYFSLVSRASACEIGLFASAMLIVSANAWAPTARNSVSASRVTKTAGNLLIPFLLLGQTFGFAGNRRNR